MQIQEIEAIFHQARAIPAGPDRIAWLKSRCNSDAALFEEVLSLIEADANLRAAQTIARPDTPLVIPDALFGPYRAIGFLGRGGTSTVYRGERADGAFQQTVAIKIVAGYMAVPEFLQRFETERQLLASLSHNNITHLLDGGVSPAGDPYLITEFVDGQPVDRYCDAALLDIARRLAIFDQVLDAVDYAHRNLIVHRDLKPANILVNRDGVVKLLDFGTASLASTQNDVTRTRVRMLTPRYASPEQLKNERVNISTDIYSLGVILYELLCGAWPFGDPDSVLSELNRATGEVAPSAPAMVITEKAATDRAISLAQLKGALSGDLSTILLKMLEDEPAKRYGSVREVAEDLQRYRQGRPILARPQTPWYAAQKFVRRHWVAVTAVSLALIALASLTVFSIHEAVQARKLAARAERVSEFAKDTFLSASSTWTSPLRGKSRAIQFSDILDNAAERVGRELGHDPAAEADMRGMIGSTYAILGDPVKGEAQIRQAIELAKRTPDVPKHVEADLQVRLCNAASYQGHYQEALTACRAAMDIASVYGTSMGYAAIVHDVAYMAVKSGAPLAEAEKLYRKAAKIPVTDPRQAKLWPALNNTRIGALRVKQGDLEEGERLLRECERAFRAEPGPPIEILPTLVALSQAAKTRGDFSEATRWSKDGLDLLTARPTAYMGRNQVEIELAADEALAERPGALARLERVSGEIQAAASVAVEQVRFHLLSGIVEAREGSKELAEQHLRAALAISEKELPHQPEDRVEIDLRLAELMTSLHRDSEAAEFARQGLETAQAAYGKYFAIHPWVAKLRAFSVLSAAKHN